jgi:hypothetical protein
VTANSAKADFGRLEFLQKALLLMVRRMMGKNEAACAADASREVVERWLPKG